MTYNWTVNSRAWLRMTHVSARRLPCQLDLPAWRMETEHQLVARWLGAFDCAIEHSFDDSVRETHALPQLFLPERQLLQISVAVE